jgi:hypothetical protein
MVPSTSAVAADSYRRRTTDRRTPTLLFLRIGGERGVQTLLMPPNAVRDSTLPLGASAPCRTTSRSARSAGSTRALSDGPVIAGSLAGRLGKPTSRQNRIPAVRHHRGPQRALLWARCGARSLARRDARVERKRAGMTSPSARPSARRRHEQGFRSHPVVAVGVRRGSCARFRRSSSWNFGLLWSRARAGAWSASGSGTPSRGASGEERGCRGPGPPPPSDSLGPGEEPDLRYNRLGTSIRAVTPRTNKGGKTSLAASSDSISTFSLATPTTAAINAGTARDASETRTQKCDRLCLAEPQATQSPKKPSSKKTTIMITLAYTLPER